MNDFFDKLDEFLAAAKTKAADVAEKAAGALDELAAWVRAHSGSRAAAPAVDAARLAKCEAEIQALAPAAGARGAIGGPFADFLVKLIAAILASLK